MQSKSSPSIRRAAFFCFRKRLVCIIKSQIYFPSYRSSTDFFRICICYRSMTALQQILSIFVNSSIKKDEVS